MNVYHYPSGPEPRRLPGEAAFPGRAGAAPPGGAERSGARPAPTWSREEEVGAREKRKLQQQQPPPAREAPAGSQRRGGGGGGGGRGRVSAAGLGGSRAAGSAHGGGRDSVSFFLKKKIISAPKLGTCGEAAAVGAPRGRAPCPRCRAPAVRPRPARELLPGSPHLRAEPRLLLPGARP